MISYEYHIILLDPASLVDQIPHPHLFAPLAPQVAGPTTPRHCGLGIGGHSTAPESWPWDLIVSEGRERM